MRKITVILLSGLLALTLAIPTTSAYAEEVLTSPTPTTEVLAESPAAESTTPTETATVTPSEAPSEYPTASATVTPTETPTATPSATPTATPTPSEATLVYEDGELSDALKEYYELKEDEDTSTLIDHTIYVDPEGNSYFYGYIVGQEEESLGFYLVDLETKEFKKAEGFVSREEELIALLTEPEISLMSAADPNNLYVAAAPLGNDATGDGSVANPYETINQAYTEASASATIHVMTNLTYNNLQFTDNKVITLTSCDTSGVDATVPTDAHILTDTSTGTGFNITKGELTTTFITFDGNKGGGHANTSYPIYLNGATAKWSLNEYTTIQNYQNNNGSSGGIILVRAGELNANGATIQNNSVPNQAAAGIYLIGSATGGTITNCTFKNNNSKQFGALTSTAANVTLDVSGSTFENNTNDTNGAGIYVSAGANLNINESTFTGNIAANAGGAVFSGSSTNVMIQKSTFTNNQAVNTSGGAIYSTGGATITTTIQECTMNGNSSGTNGYGGAVAQSSASGTLNITDSNFANNTATKNNGGAAWSNGTLNITSTTGKTSTWDANTTTTGSGGAACAKTLTVIAADPNGIVFSNNTSASNGGALYASGASAVFTNVSFTGNQTTGTDKDGGAVYCDDTADFLNCNFSQNTAIRSGGAIRVGKNTTITGSTFTDNTAGANGGAVIQTATSDAIITKITDSSFTSNSATTGNGGAVFTNASSQLVINNTTGNAVTFDRNVTNKGAGGAVYAGGPLSLVALNFGDITFTNNSSTSHAGALYTNNATTSIEKISFTANKTTATGANGGAIYNNKTANYADCKFEQNESFKGGGAIYLNGDSINVASSEFTNNTAGENGGAIGSYNNKSAVISNSTFDSNTAGNYAGAIYMDLITLTDSTITNNTAKVGGGYVGGNRTETSVISGSTISNNTASQNGGGIYTNGVIEITDTTIANNKATLGAGIFTHVYGSYKAVINLGQDAKVTNNTSSGGGAGIYVYGGTTVNMTDNSSITNNFATIGEGGGIYQANNGLVTMKDTASITGNHCAANKNSGGVYNVNANDGSFKVQDNVVIDHNYFGTGSADIYAANYYVNNTAAAKNSYEITLSGALGTDAHISVMTKVNMKDILIAKPDAGYTITDSDLAKFSHDRITRGNLDGMPIVFDSDGSTGSTNNLELYASQYKEIHIYDGTADPAEVFVGLPGANADITHYEPRYGFTLDHISQQSSLTGNVEQTVPTGGTVVIPDDDSLIIRYYNTRNDYTVKFAMEDPSIGSLTGAANQTVAYNDHAVAGATAVADDPVNYYFTGWKYQIETESGTVYGSVMDYTSIPVTGDVTFVATFAKVPFIEIDTPIYGSLSIIDGTTPKPITDGIVNDRYEWPEGAVSPYAGVGAFKANPNYKVKSITVNDFKGTTVTIPLTTGSSVNIAGGTATLTIDANNTFGNVQLTGLTRSAQITVEFEKLPTVQVIYHSNGGTPDPLETREVALGSIVGAKPASDPTRDDYRLVGWSTDPNATFDEYNADYVVTQADINAGTIDYYAVWDFNTENEYDILVYLQTGVDGSNNPIYTLSSEDSYLRATASAGTTVYAYNTANPGPKEITGYTWNSTAPGTLVSGEVAPPEDPRLVLRLYYDANQYDVTYHENGGSAVAAPNPKQVYYKDTLPTVTTTRSGYTLEGWYKEPGFVNKVTLGTDTMPANDLDLYARWIPDEYNITYDLGGGTNDPDNPNKYIYGVGVTFKNPTKDHYDFGGWYTEAGFVHPITQISPTDTGDKKVFAKWSPTEYDITYTLNGGTVSGTNPTTYNVETASFTLHNPTKTGYIFDGWSGTGISTETTTVTVTQGSFGDRDYTANFTPITYKVSFDPNGGTGTTMANQNFTYDVAQNLSTNTYTKTGYTFGGWATSATGSAVYTDAQNVNNLTTTNNATYPLYATWVAATDTAYKVEHYQQNVSGSGYSLVSADTENKTGTTGAAATYTNETYTGFTYVSTKTTFEDSDHTAQAGALTIAADGTLVIKLYYDRNEHDITYSATIPSGCSATVPTGENDVLFGASKTRASNLSCPGYTFSGWTTSDVMVSGSGTFTMPDNDVDFVGSFTENTITITYQPNNSHGSVTPTSENVLASTGTATGSSASADTGYKFTGWTKDSVSVGTNTAFTPSKNATSGLYETATYVANFEPISYEVEFDKNASDATGTMANEEFDYDETKALTSNGFTRTGYTFGGWSLTSGGALAYANGASVSNLTTTDNGTVKLYALWTANTTTAYRVEHYQQNLTGTGYTIVPADTQNKTGTTGGAAVVGANTYPGFTEITASPTYESTDNTASTTVLSIAPDGSLVVKYYYDRNTHDITYVSTPPGGCTVTVPAGETGVRYGTSETVESDLSCTGYTFSGWTPTGVTVSGTTYTMPDNNVTFTGTWTANTGTAYVVEHYQEDLTGGTYTLHDTENKSGTTGTAASVTAKTYTGFTYNATATTYEDSGHTASSTVLTIAADGTLVVKLYYTRNKHDITYTSAIPAACTTVTNPSNSTNVPYGTNETVAADLSCAGYTFSGWTPTGVTPSAGNYTMPDNDVSFNGTWTEIQVTITYDTNNAHGSVSNPSETIGSSTGTPSGSTATADTGYKFTGWTSGGSTVATTPAYTPTKDATTHLFVTATYTANFEPISYEVAFDKNAADATGTMANESFDYDATKPLTTNAFTRPGYTFGGWGTVAAGPVVYADNANVSNLTTTDGTTINLFAQWTANTTTAYTVEVYLRDLNSTTDYTQSTAHTQNLTGTTDTTASYTAPSIVGFTQETTKTTYEDSANTASTTVLTIAGDGTLVIKLYYSRNTHTVTYSYTGTAPTGAPSVPAQATYEYGDTFSVDTTVPAATVPGYTFSGWNQSGTVNVEDSDIGITGTWTANGSTPYTVNHFKQQDDGTYSTTPSDVENKTGQTDTTANAVPKTYTGYTLDITVTGTVQSGNIDGDGSLVLALYYRQNTYTVRFNKNATDATGTMSNQNFLYDKADTLTTNAFARPGYYFVGWSESSSATTADYTDAQSVSQLTNSDGATVDLYAVWRRITPVVMDPPTQKTITGDTPTTGETFTFALRAISCDNPAITVLPMPDNAPGQSMQKSIVGSGSVEFGNITFTDPGIYVYEIEEVAGVNPQYVYDTNVITVTYTITQGATSLNGVRTMEDANHNVVTVAEFKNQYTAPVVPVDPGTSGPVGRTCQDDGYPEGYYWNGTACVAGNGTTTAHKNGYNIPYSGVNDQVFWYWILLGLSCLAILLLNKNQSRQA